MLDQKDNLLSSYNYDLPNNLIAQSPTEPRHDAKLMIIKNELDDALNLTHAKIWDLKDILKKGDLLVVNNTRVLKARLKIRLSGGGQGELWWMSRELEEAKKYMSPAQRRKLERQQAATAAAGGDGGEGKE